MKAKLTVDTQEKMRNKSKCTTKESHLPTWAESSKKKKRRRRSGRSKQRNTNAARKLISKSQ